MAHYPGNSLSDSMTTQDSQAKENQMDNTSEQWCRTSPVFLNKDNGSLSCVLQCETSTSRRRSGPGHIAYRQNNQGSCAVCCTKTPPIPTHHTQDLCPLSRPVCQRDKRQTASPDMLPLGLHKKPEMTGPKSIFIIFVKIKASASRRRHAGNLGKIHLCTLPLSTPPLLSKFTLAPNS